MKTDQPGFFDKAGNIKKLLRIFFSLCGGLFLLDFVLHRHVIHPWDHLWGFYALFGFVACVALVLGAKEMRKVVMRNEQYYDE